MTLSSFNVVFYGNKLRLPKNQKHNDKTSFYYDMLAVIAQLKHREHCAHFSLFAVFNEN